MEHRRRLDALRQSVDMYRSRLGLAFEQRTGACRCRDLSMNLRDHIAAESSTCGYLKAWVGSVAVSGPAEPARGGEFFAPTATVAQARAVSCAEPCALNPHASCVAFVPHVLL